MKLGINVQTLPLLLVCCDLSESVSETNSLLCDRNTSPNTQVCVVTKRKNVIQESGHA